MAEACDRIRLQFMGGKVVRKWHGCSALGPTWFHQRQCRAVIQKLVVVHLGRDFLYKPEIHYCVHKCPPMDAPHTVNFFCVLLLVLASGVTVHDDDDDVKDKVFGY